LQIEDEEIPTASELTYVVESAGEVAEARHGTDDNSAIIFCIDISGSMCVSKAVSGHLNLKTNKHQELMKLAGLDEQEQHMPGERRDITYVSRLECVQGAIESQLKELKHGASNRRVGIVTFNGEVRVIGDGRADEVITGDRLYSHDHISKAFEGRFENLMGRNVGETADELIAKVYQLEEGGPTALGPALLASIILAAQGGVGSKVIICTDGLANVGLGSLEFGLEETSEAFYAELGRFASEKGISVSLISIEGEECKLERLSTITELTNGDILRVQPEHISEEFANILSDNVIATHVNLTVILHKALYFRNEDAADLSWNKSRLNKKIGNATASSSVTFSYGLKQNAILLREGIDKNALKEVPMQSIIRYSSLNGMKCVRSITRIQPVTFDLNQARQDAKFDILARAGTRQAAKMAMEGRFGAAKEHAQLWKEKLQEQVVNEEQEMELNALEADLMEIDEGVQHQMRVEQEIGVHYSEDIDRAELKNERRKNYADDFTSKIKGLIKKKKRNN